LRKNRRAISCLESKKRKSSIEENQKNERTTTENYEKDKGANYDTGECQTIYKVDLCNLLLVELI